MGASNWQFRELPIAQHFPFDCNAKFGKCILCCFCFDFLYLKNFNVANLLIFARHNHVLIVLFFSWCVCCLLGIHLNERFTAWLALYELGRCFWFWFYVFWFDCFLICGNHSVAYILRFLNLIIVWNHLPEHYKPYVHLGIWCVSRNLPRNLEYFRPGLCMANLAVEYSFWLIHSLWHATQWDTKEKEKQNDIKVINWAVGSLFLTKNQIMCIMVPVAAAS